MESAWNRSVLRTNNERLLLDRLRADGATSRAELARLTGLSKPTVSTALGRLEHGGLVREIGKQAMAGRGRSPVLYEADPTAGYAIGVDVGRSWIRVGIADLDGTVVGRSDCRNEAADADGIVDTIVAQAHRAATQAAVDWPRILHTVVGSPGVIDAATNELRYAVNLPGWGRREVTDRLAASLGTGLEVLNDANLAALGEHAAGSGRDCRLFVYLHIGTGLGSGIVVDGKLFPGAHGAAGEVGYLPYGPYNEDRARTRGLLEDAVAADSVVAIARESGMADATSAKDVFLAARAGNATALEVVRREAERLAHAVASIAAVIDPELIVLGGGIGDSADLLLEPLRATLDKMTPLVPELAASVLGANAVLEGALASGVRTVRGLVFEAWQGAQESAGAS
ncbi:ROK family protein [Catenulispora sp. NF23]|uniref:ROK family protein n=1 Tax=Catenulispora pinistramenti TaxID=2705254 RepID=A0ABS5L922_9ACTN|nr:ROK family protein [Catenulispora pinistramenti]MBS2540176.1 ROK family protein [Catenulispora pinistramenti]MBS2554732.1 ROK family protein [Catenulispora pinistramenti]